MNTPVNFYDLSNPQKTIYYTQKFYKNTSISNISGTLRIEKELNFKIFERAINKVVEVNDSLRLFLSYKGNKVMQIFKSYKKFGIELFDVKNEDELKNLENKLVQIPFSNKDEYLFRFIMFRFPNGFGGCNIVCNHMISDAWTSTMICDQIVEYYYKLLNNENIENKIFSYEDFLIDEKKYEESEKYIQDKQYWENKFSSYKELATLSKNIDENLDCKAKRIEYNLSKKQSKHIANFCLENNISVYAFFLTIYSIYISRVTALDNITIGTPILNRKNLKEKSTMGMYINTIPVNINLSENITILECLKNISKEVLSILRHQRYPYMELLKYVRQKYNNTRGLYDIIVSYQNAKTKSNQFDIPYFAKWNFNGNLSETLNIHISDLDNSSMLNIYYDYQVSKLTEQDIKNIHNRVLFIINQVIENNTLLIDNIDIVPENEKKIINNINKNFNATYPKDKSISEIFEEQVIKYPERIAISLNYENINYKELNERANSLARFLISRGVKKNVPVGIRINKSIEMIVGILAIVKAGGCYLPIDLSYPEERVSFMLKDSNAKILLTNSNSNNMNFNIEIINLDDENIYDKNCDNLNLKTNIDNLLYIIYTSGSTGNPKGAMLTHRNVIRLMKNDKFLFDFNEDDVWTMFHSVAFDFSVWEMYGALLYGGKLVLVPENIAKSPKAFLNLLRNEKVTVLNQTPTFFYNLLEQEIKNNNDSLLQIRYIIFGGEALKPNLIKSWKDKYPFTKLINMYGITETTVHVTFKELSNNDLMSSNSNIGVPIPTLKLLILDNKQRLLPLGIEGEICVVGDGVGRGYLNRPDLNNQKFVEINGQKTYRSADSAFIDFDGNIYYKGRIDTQVKIRGFRVELGEIEAKLLKHPCISKCIVIADKKSEKDSHLVAYIVCNKDVKIEELKEYMKKLVPSYMVPNYFVKLDYIPMNNNGKADIKLLKNMDYTIERESEYVAPRNDFEKNLKTIIQEEMHVDKISIDDDILNLGADSLTLMRIVAKLLDTGNEVSIQEFYENKTIRNISDNLNADFEKIGNFKDNIYYTFEDDNPQDKIEFRNILLTGSTGFLGIHILHDIINNTKSNIYCLIRSKNGVDVKTRLKEKIKFYFNDNTLEQIDNRIFVVEGDISEYHLGLNFDEYNKLGLKIDNLINSAANVNHYGSKEIFEKINVYGTQNIIDFCKEFSIKLNHISTMSVSADFVAKNKVYSTFNEHCLFIGQPYEKNIYVKTKFEAEYNIWKEHDLEFAIYRLGNITSRFSDGKFQENDYQNAFKNRITSFINIGKVTKELFEYKFDFSPVDICSKFITEIMQYKSSYNKVFHISNNNTISMKDIEDDLHIKSFKIVSEQDFLENVKKSQNKMGLINDLTNKTILEKNIDINSDFTVNYLSKLNLHWPKIDKNYVEKYISTERVGS